VGFVEWQDAKIAQQAWLGIAEAAKLKILRQTLGNLDPEFWPERDPRGRPRDPLHESARVPVVWVEKRKPMLFTTSSDTGTKAVKRLVRDCIEGGRDGHVPITKLEISSFQHSNRSIGEIFFPVFELHDWIPAAQVLEMLEACGPVFGIAQHQIENN
jgi:hypothetical protein